MNLEKRRTGSVDLREELRQIVTKAAAQVAGEAEMADVFVRLHDQEQAMAHWHDEHLAELTRQFLVRHETPDVLAKH